MRRLILLACALGLPADAIAHHQEFVPPPPFALFSPAVGDITPAPANHAYQTSSRIAALADGALASDADTGELLRVDAHGALTAELAIGKDAGLLAYDDVAHRAYIADRRGDRIVAVDVGDGLAIARTWRTPAEPYAVALSPDRQTLYATAIADRVLVAYDAATGRERWRAAVDAEPRGLAIAGDGERAAVTSLTSSSIVEVALTSDHAVARRALPSFQDLEHTRGAFAVTYLGAGVAVTAFQSERPVPVEDEGAEHYGGSFFPPLEHHLAFLDTHDHAALATTNVHEPRAVTWDPAHDTLYVAGIATDNIVAVRHASQVDVAFAGEAHVRGKDRCGADGLAIADDGQVLVWCSLSRQVARVTFPTGKVERGPELVPSSLDAQQHEGMALFHTADANISAFGGMSCGNCHLDGRSDGQSWLIHGERLQTPMLCGRVASTAPYKWDGTAPTLTASLRQTVERLGGDGLSKRHLASLAAYLEGMPAARTPTHDATAVAHGKQLFESGELGCASCHDGPVYTDRQRHSLDGEHAFDTPSLVGIASSAPYFHDGSAATLEVVLRDRGHVHGMSDGATLSDHDVADLKAFLETL